MQREGSQNKLFIPPPNILEGNRVVFETLVKKRSPIIKKISWKEGGSKNIIHVPSKYS